VFDDLALVVTAQPGAGNTTRIPGARRRWSADPPAAEARGCAQSRSESRKSAAGGSWEIGWHIRLSDDSAREPVCRD
jgi:hypothetical protein